MTKETTMMLAKNLNLAKMTYPCAASPKLDGVPGVFRLRGAEGSVEACTRQGLRIKSVNHIQTWLRGKLPPRHQLIGELYVDGLPFRIISGWARCSDTAPRLQLHIWDYYVEDEPSLTYMARMDRLCDSEIYSSILDNEEDSPVQLLNGRVLFSEEELLHHIDEYTRHFPISEGLIIRPLHGKNSLYEAGKRSWGFQRVKKEETVDLRLVGIEEAVDAETGEGKSMAGGLICAYKGDLIGVGPGALSHYQRELLFYNPEVYVGQIIEVSYKPDPTYKALREARFKQFRPDKDEQSIE